MKIRCRAFYWLFFLGIAVLAIPAPQKDDTEEKGLAVMRGSFLRMDLLRAEKKPLPPPRRNIFTARNTVIEEADPEFLGEGISTEERIPVSPTGQKISALYLRYVGYVRSGERMVALIIYQGEALAVAEGEMIEDGVIVNRIRPEEIEVTGPDSEPSTFSLEGELP